MNQLKMNKGNNKVCSVSLQTERGKRALHGLFVSRFVFVYACVAERHWFYFTVVKNSSNNVKTTEQGHTQEVPKGKKMHRICENVMGNAYLMGQKNVVFCQKMNAFFFFCHLQILNNWKYHKPKVASYWLVKLDATKQRKVKYYKSTYRL